MESSARRCAPPPPSAPPPAHISRSGRVPLPKGEPPGDARRARHPSRGHPLSPPFLGPTRRIRKDGRLEEHGAAERSTAEYASRRPRSGDRRRDSGSDEGTLNTSSESTEEFVWNVVNDGAERDTHPLPVVSRRRTSDSPKCKLPGGTTSRNSGKSVSHSPRNRSSSGEWGRDIESRGHGRDKGGELRGTSSNSNSSRDDGPDKKANRKGRRERGYGRKGGQRASWGRNSTPERRRDTRHSYGSDRRHWRQDTTSDLDSEGEAGRLFSRSEKHKQHRPRESRSPLENINYGKGKNRDGHQLNNSSTDERGYSDLGSNSSSQSRPQKQEIPSRNRSKSEGMVERKNGRRRKKEIDKEDEEFANSPVLTRKGDDKALYQDMEPGDGASCAGDGTLRTQRSSTQSTDRDKEVCGSHTRENSRERPVSGRGASPTGSGHSVTDCTAASHPPTNHNASPRSPSGTLSGTSKGVTYGKPIRGARWGEAIGVRSKVFDTTTIPTAKGDLKSFVISPLRSGPGTVLRCFIERKRSGTHNFSNMFSMYADLEDGSGRLLLAARKLLASKTAYYIICIRQDDLFKDTGKRGGTSFLGKLRASTPAHTEYALYDRGENPASIAVEKTGETGGDAESKTKNPAELDRVNGARGDTQNGGELRKELGVIVYTFDKREQRTGKRRMEVAIPQLHQQGDTWEPVSWQPSELKEGMKPSFGRIRYQGAQNLLQDDRLLVFHQRESRYDPLSSCLVDFRGRATAPSVKNFQLIKSSPEDNVKRVRYYNEGAGKDDCESDDVPRPVFLQMGKVGKDCFNVDVEWPLSLLQAFAICLSRFDTSAHF